MQKAIILSTNDIKAIIAEKYGVPFKNVVKSQYSFTVITEGNECYISKVQVSSEES